MDVEARVAQSTRALLVVGSLSNGHFHTLTKSVQKEAQHLFQLRSIGNIQRFHGPDHLLSFFVEDL